MGMPTVTIPRTMRPPKVPRDYERLLESRSPEDINYNTRLRDRDDVDIYQIDHLYGRITDKDVLLKNMEYLMFQDDFRSVYRLLRDNPDVFTKEEASRILHNCVRLIPVYPVRADSGLLDKRAAFEFAKRFSAVWDGLWEHGALKPRHLAKNRWKMKRKQKLDEVSPYLSEPRRPDPAIRDKANKDFTDALAAKDVEKACLALRKYTRYIAMDAEKLNRYLNLFQDIHSGEERDEKREAYLRKVWWTTTRKSKVLIKLMEPFGEEGAEEAREDFDKQMDIWKAEQWQKNVDKWLEKGIDVRKFNRDFSNAVPMDAVPVVDDPYTFDLDAYWEQLEREGRLPKVNLDHEVVGEVADDAAIAEEEAAIEEGDASGATEAS
ncbi:unnamed protein product [Vitrella brassicaformis CCMP3155]|uniref:Uncharacterized protein n=1 Tax=Vitrella brassicaformis (strain CCMP3155) TaxID=1169540 RepID=A0A0G4ECP8_VITBC|nr:unnamed protein product [Vitrella brassicaformis CCMP3155]|eukprot:CEL93086.1 unnamed protein product [Vitrella brassicaformis CCMP3155]